jgi:quinol-cytochrome oxidoreductase complex cytochrome b subunit
MSSGRMRRLGAWLSERAGLGLLAERFGCDRRGRAGLEKRLGSAALLLFLVLAGTGALLALHYQPAAEQAQASLRRLDGAVPFGQLVRRGHCWASHLFVLVLGAQLLVRLASRSYRGDGELEWLAGLGVVGLGLGITFTGTVLPWSLEAQAGARVAGSLASEVPWLGSWLRRCVLGDDTLTASTLPRMAALHLALLPAALVLLAAAQALFGWARRSRWVEPARSAAPARTPAERAALWVALLLLLLVMVLLVRPGLGTPGELPLPTPPSARPTWVFAWLHGLLRLTPRSLLGLSGTATIVVGGLGVVGLAALLPFVDRRGSRATIGLACGALASFLGLTAYGLLA